MTRILYNSKKTIAGWLAEEVDTNKDGQISVGELQQALVELTAHLTSDTALTPADAKDLAILTVLHRTGFVDVENLRARCVAR